MPLYPLRCTSSTCVHEFDEFCQSWRLRDAIACPKCGADHCEVRMGDVHIRTEPTFYGQRAESVMHQFSPREIKDVRKAGVTAGRICDKTGRVSFDSRSDERAFSRQLHSVRQVADPAYQMAKSLKETRERRAAEGCSGRPRRKAPPMRRR